MPKRRRGSVLSTVLLVSMFLMMITALIADNALHHFRTTNWAGKAGTSRYIAYAGIQHALVILKQQPEWSGNIPRTPVPGRPELFYEVKVENQRSPVEMGHHGLPFNIQVVPENAAKITSRVFWDDGSATRELSGMIGTAVWRPTSFINAASARTSVIMEGDSKTRAYDFAWYDSGARDSGSTDVQSGYIDPEEPDASPTPNGNGNGNGNNPGTFTRGKASVESTQVMTVEDTSKIEGDLIRPEYDEDTPVGAIRSMIDDIAPDIASQIDQNNPQEDVNYTGEKKRPTTSADIRASSPPYNPDEAVIEQANFPAVPRLDQWGNPVYNMQGDQIYDPATLEPGPYKNITVPAGQQLKLKPGRYYVSEQFKVDGEIVVDEFAQGDVIFFVGEKMVVSGSGKVNFYGDPARLQLCFCDQDQPETSPGVVNTESVFGRSRGFSTLQMEPGAKATMVAQGKNLVARIDGARLLGSVAGMLVHLKSGATIEYSTQLQSRQMAGGNPWKLQGVYERVVR